MDINNNQQISGIRNIILGKTPNQTGKTGTPEISPSGFVLPDIRSSQILLPDNKIYLINDGSILLPKGSKPADFNTTNITIEVPENYTEARELHPVTAITKKLIPNSDVTQYENTKTGEQVIRVSRNNFTDEGLLNSSEVTEINPEHPNLAIKYVKDFEHNTETEIIIRNPLRKKDSSILSKTTIYKDEEGKVVKKEEYQKSPFLKGVYDITETDADGKETIVSRTTKNENGDILLERNLVSLDGTKTVYRFLTDESGEHKKMFCQISDKDGKILSTIDRTYDKTDENTTVSTINGNKYEITRTQDGVKITDFTKNNETEMKEEDFNATEETKELITMMSQSKPRKLSDENVAGTLFDTLPGDTLLTLQGNIQQIIPLEDDLDSAFVGVFDYLMCKTDNFVVNHELGHSKDAERVAPEDNLLTLKSKNVIADVPEFKKTYVEEKAAFVQAFPDFEEKFINYFLNSPEKKPDRGIKETVAESNAINGLQPSEPESIAMRTIILQRYFPRSMALLTNMMNPIAHSEISENSNNQE